MVGAGPWGLTLGARIRHGFRGVALRWICELDDDRRARAAAGRTRARG